jgi:hypothetical protein
MIGSFIGAWILTGVMSTFLFLGRSGANIQHYNDMESQARKALELFAEDVRQASSLTWNGPSDVTLIVNSQFIRYYLSSTKPNGATYAQVSGMCFYRIPPSSSAPAIPTTPPANTLLLNGIITPVARASDADTACTPFFRAYTITGSEIKSLEYATPSASTLATVANTTKQIQISLEASRSRTTLVTATNTVLSARFILRNKRVTT